MLSTAPTTRRPPTTRPRAASTSWFRAGALALLFATGGAELGCSPPESAEPSVADRLRASFPVQAAALLDGDCAFVEEGDAFVAPGTSGARRVALRLPRAGAEPMAMQAGELTISVHELGIEGDRDASGAAIVYPRRGGASIWSPTDAGFEEWLLLEAGAARPDRPVAAWDVEGASVRSAGGGAEILDATGAARIRVTAPVAYAKSGRALPVRLDVVGGRIEVVVDGDGDEVLLDPSWTSTTSMAGPRYMHTATTMPGGKVLVVGGLSSGSPLASAEVRDPATSTWSSAGSMVVARDHHRAVLLPNGKVLVAGGQGSAGFLASAELYDPATSAWSLASSMTVARFYPTATVLQSGKVLVAGGSASTASAEIYAPLTNTWSAAASMAVTRYHHTATLLPDGRVLVAGGVGASDLASAELYDPTADTWSPAASMAAARVDHSATLLPSGRVLVAGHFGASSLASAELYDPATNTWSPAASMTAAGGYHTATLVTSGKVLVAGGFNSSFLADASIYDPAGNSWSPAPPLANARDAHTATLLTSGKILIAGGNGPGGALATVELFSFDDPGAACSSGTDCASGFCADGVCCDTACSDGLCDACSVAAGGVVDGTCKAVTCVALDQCHVAGACVPGSGQCLTPSKPDGAGCDDGNACTQSTCQAGVCSAIGAVACSALDQCHAPGTCDPITGLCSNPAAPDGSPCSDGDACTLADTCLAGACAGGGALACLALDPCHVAGDCDGVTGLCSHPAQTDGTPCDDGDVCTLADGCQAGVCAGGPPLQCAPLDECHLGGTCDSGTGACSNPAKADGDACSLGSCQAGICTATPDAGTSGAPDGGAGAGGVMAGSSTGEASAGGGVGAATAGGGAGDAGGDGPALAESGGCGCVVAGAHGEASLGALGIAAALIGRRRAGRRRRGSSHRSCALLD